MLLVFGTWRNDVFLFLGNEYEQMVPIKFSKWKCYNIYYIVLQVITTKYVVKV